MKQVTELPVKRISDFNQTQSDANLVRRPGFWLGFIGFVGLAFIIGLVVSVEMVIGNLTWIFAGAFAFACFGGFRIIDLAEEARAERGKVYDQYLATISYDILKAVASSPEYDQETKYAVIKYLSAAHPGWSLIY